MAKLLNFFYLFVCVLSHKCKDDDLGLDRNSLQSLINSTLTDSGICIQVYTLLWIDMVYLMSIFYIHLGRSYAELNCGHQELFSWTQNCLANNLPILEITWGIIRGAFGSSPWLDDTGDDLVRAREGRQLGGGEAKGSRLWPGARVPYEFADTIDFNEWSIMQRIFSNISSVTNIKFVPRFVLYYYLCLLINHNLI